MLGALAGALLFRGAPVVGLMIGLAIGHAVDAGWFKRRPENPYEALGLEPDATTAEIDLAYRRLMSRYHPDKVANADPEARRQAEKESQPDQRRLRPDSTAAQALSEGRAPQAGAWEMSRLCAACWLQSEPVWDQ